MKDKIIKKAKELLNKKTNENQSEYINDLKNNLSDLLFLIENTLHTDANENINEIRQRTEDALTFSLLLARKTNDYTEDQIIDFGLEESVRLTNSKIGYYHFVNEKEKTISLHTWNKETLKNCHVAERVHNYPFKEAGIWIDSLRNRKPVIHNDYAGYPHKKGLPEGHFPLIRHMSAPVFDGDKIVAIIGVGNKETDYDNLDERQLSLLARTIYSVILQKRMQKKIKQSEQWFKAIFNNTKDGILVCDIEKKQIAMANPIMCQMLNYTNNEITQLKTSDIYPFDCSDSIEKLNIKKEIRVKRKDTSIFYADVNASIISFEGREYLLSSFRDNTERKKKELELRKLSAVVKQSPFYIVITDLEGNIEYVNPAFYETTGYTFEEIKEKNPRILQSGQTPTIVYENLWNTITKGKIWQGEFINKRKNGEIYFEGVVIAPIKDHDGNITHYFAIKEDITKMKKAEKALRQSEIRYRTLFENAQIGICLSTLEGQVIQANQSLADMYGYSVHEKNEVDLNKVYANHQDRIKLKNELQKYGFSKNNELKALTKNRKTIVVNVNAAIVELENTKFILSSQIDITERKKSEKLEKKQKKQLEEQNKQLQELNATKDKFFSIIAHDLKSPFNTLLGFSETLLNKKAKYSDVQKNEFIKLIYQNIQRTYDLLDNLLVWSRTQTNRMPFKLKDFPIKNIVQETILLLEDTSKKKKIQLKTSIKENFIVCADYDMIKTVMRNLLSNAIKFTPCQGKIKIQITAKNKKQIQIGIIDSGVGIDENNISKLFRIDKNYTTLGTNNEVGTGLGLILCKEFVEKNNGKIWVKSKKGEGSSFFFTLNLKKENTSPKKQDIVINTDDLITEISKQEIQQKFNPEILELLNRISKKFRQKEIQQLIVLLQKIAQENNAALLKQFCEKLQNELDHFNIKAIQQSISQIEKGLRQD